MISGLPSLPATSRATRSVGVSGPTRCERRPSTIATLSIPQYASHVVARPGPAQTPDGSRQQRTVADEGPYGTPVVPGDLLVQRGEPFVTHRHRLSSSHRPSVRHRPSASVLQLIASIIFRSVCAVEWRQHVRAEPQILSRWAGMRKPESTVLHPARRTTLPDSQNPSVLNELLVAVLVVPLARSQILTSKPRPPATSRRPNGPPAGLGPAGRSLSVTSSHRS